MYDDQNNNSERQHRSSFARDFYAAGAQQEDHQVPLVQPYSAQPQVYPAYQNNAYGQMPYDNSQAQTNAQIARQNRNYGQLGRQNVLNQNNANYGPPPMQDMGYQQQQQQAYMQPPPGQVQQVYLPPQQHQELQRAALHDPQQIRQRQQVQRMKSEQLNDGCFSFMVFLISALYGGLSSHEECSKCHMVLWVHVETGYYLFNIFFVYCYYQHIKRRNRENIKFIIFNCFLNVIHSAWLIYGNVIYFKYHTECNDQFVAAMRPEPPAESYTTDTIVWIMLAQVVMGYFTLLKCCSIGTIILCFGPAFYRSMRRARRPDAQWVPTQTDVLKNMMKGNFKPEEHAEGLECIICMVEYQPDDETILLPCDERHFFHADCIQNWLKSNNSCPLCKKPITMADIKNQKKEKRSKRRQSQRD